MRNGFISLLMLHLGAAIGLAAEPEFPLKVSGNHRYLVDQAGAPFLYHADTPWTLFTKLTEGEAT